MVPDPAPRFRARFSGTGVVPYATAQIWFPEPYGLYWGSPVLCEPETATPLIPRPSLSEIAGAATRAGTVAQFPRFIRSSSGSESKPFPRIIQGQSRRLNYPIFPPLCCVPPSRAETLGILGGCFASRRAESSLTAQRGETNLSWVGHSSWDTLNEVGIRRTVGDQ